jgi:indolepyruvate ferredoxin oxidoreductase
VFGYTAERRMERQLVEDYRRTIEDALPVLNRENAELVAKIAALPDMIKGYGYVKDDNFAKYQAELKRLLASFDGAIQAKAA